MSRLCENCGKEFVALHNPKRRACSRSCSNALSWKDPEKSAKRRASIEKARRTPESRARSTEVNNRRWADPAKRQRLSDWNRKQWSNPKTRKKLTAGIKRVQGSAERRLFYSRLRVEQWANDPEYRRKTEEGIKRSKGTPEARAFFSAVLRERWTDPKMRAKYTAANHARNNPAHRERMRGLMLKRWREDADFRALVSVSMEDYWSRPESKEFHAERLKALWANPAWRARQLGLIAAHPNTPQRIKRGLSSSVATGAADLVNEIDAVIPRGLPDFMRADLASDLALALLEGELKIDNLKSEVKAYLTAHRRMFPDKWGPISIDAPIPGTDGFTIADTLADDAPHF